MKWMHLFHTYSLFNTIKSPYSDSRYLLRNYFVFILINIMFVPLRTRIFGDVLPCQRQPTTVDSDRLTRNNFEAATAVPKGRWILSFLVGSCSTGCTCTKSDSVFRRGWFLPHLSIVQNLWKSILHCTNIALRSLSRSTCFSKFCETWTFFYRV